MPEVLYKSKLLSANITMIIDFVSFQIIFRSKCFVARVAFEHCFLPEATMLIMLLMIIQTDSQLKLCSTSFTQKYFQVTLIVIKHNRRNGRFKRTFWTIPDQIAAMLMHLLFKSFLMTRKIKVTESALDSTFSNDFEFQISFAFSAMTLKRELLMFMWR